MYDSPSAGVFCNIFWPGLSSNASVGARQDANLWASSSPGTVDLRLRSTAKTIIRAAATGTRTPNGHQRRAWLCRHSPVASMAAITRSENPTEGPAPRIVPGNNSSSLARRAFSLVISSAQPAQLERCRSRAGLVFPESAVSSNSSFHFVQSLFISLRPKEIFLPRAAGSGPCLRESRAPRPPLRSPCPPQLQAVTLVLVFQACVPCRCRAARGATAVPHCGRRLWSRCPWPARRRPDRVVCAILAGDSAPGGK